MLDSQPITDPTLADAVRQLATWQHGRLTAPGDHAGQQDLRQRRRDPDHGRLVAAAGAGRVPAGLGDDLYTALTGAIQVNESPSGGQNIGSVDGDANARSRTRVPSFQYGWW